MSGLPSVFFDDSVELEDEENFQEVLTRITLVLGDLKNKHQAVEFIFGSGSVDAIDGIMAQFHSLSKSQAENFEWMVDRILWDVCVTMQDRYQELSGGQFRRPNAVNDRTMNSLMREFRKSIQRASSDIAIGLLGIENSQIRREDLRLAP